MNSMTVIRDDSGVNLYSDDEAVRLSGRYDLTQVIGVRAGEVPAEIAELDEDEIEALEDQLDEEEMEELGPEAVTPVALQESLMHPFYLASLDLGGGGKGGEAIGGVHVPRGLDARGYASLCDFPSHGISLVTKGGEVDALDKLVAAGNLRKEKYESTPVYLPTEQWVAGNFRLRKEGHPAN